MLISVIVPIYNAELFLDDCLNSIIKQTINDIEIICINDGSTDNSLLIIEKYAKQDLRIVIINQDNQGVSVARNNGLAIAKGEYITFVDSNDYLDSDYLEEFFKFDNADLISSVLTANSTIERFLFNKLLNREIIETEIYPLMLKGDEFNSSCVKVFKNSIIQNHLIKFPVGMKLGEDARFILQYLMFAQNIILVENHKYHYRDNEESATRNVKDSYFFDKLFEEFEFDHKKEYQLHLSPKKILELKTLRMINSFKSCLSLYFRDNRTLLYQQRRLIIIDALTRLNLLLDKKVFDQILDSTNGRFDRFVLKSIASNSYYKLRLAYDYSHWRNNIK